MAYSQKMTGAAFTEVAVPAIPSLSSLELFLLMGGTEAASKKNYAGTFAPATKVGTPVYASGYCTLSELNGFEAPMAADNSPFTYIVVAKIPSSGTGAYCGHWTGPGFSQDLLFQSANTAFIAIDGATRATTSHTAAGWNFLAVTHDGATVAFHRIIAGAVFKDSSAYVGGAAASVKFRAGGSTSIVGTFDMASVMSAPTVLTDGAISTLYTYLKALLATRGITVN